MKGIYKARTAFYSQTMKHIYGLNKPKGISSNGILGRIRYASGQKKIGHAGTLDPLATGVLVIAVGRESTREIPHLMNKEKEYEAVITLGATSATDDSEGPITHTALPEHFSAPTREQIEEVIKPFVGTHPQTPPAFSAIHIDGKRAYELARAGKTFEIKSRPATIHAIEAISYEWPTLTIRVVTGPGVYIRSLARDIGAQLGTGGYIQELVRTRVGTFTLAEAKSADEIVALLLQG